MSELRLLFYNNLHLFNHKKMQSVQKIERRKIIMSDLKKSLSTKVL